MKKGGIWRKERAEDILPCPSLVRYSRDQNNITKTSGKKVEYAY